MAVNRVKRFIAGLVDVVRLGTLGIKIQNLVYGPYIRAIAYHSVQPDEAQNFERQVQWYSKHFENVGHAELSDLFSGRSGDRKRPGILLTFDDGTRTHFETVAPILERYGFTGWFFVPSGLLNLEADDPNDEFSKDGTRERNLTKEQITALAGSHIIGAHGVTHIRLAENLPNEILEYEIYESKNHLESILGRGVETFSWVGGEEWAFCEAASEMVRKTYRYAFMGNSDVILPSTDPHQLSRSNVESYFPMSLVRFQLSGLVDIYFTFRRRRVLQTTRKLDDIHLNASL